MLEFHTDRVGEAFAIEFEPEAPLPDEWVLRAISTDGLTVVDLTGTGSILGHVGSTDLRKTWTVTAGRPEFVDDVQQSVRDAFDARVDAFAFSPPFPNPVRGGRGTSFDLRVPATVHARVDVYDVTGRRVATLLDDTLAQGAHRVAWSGADARGQRSASGVYFVQVQAGDFSRREKVVLVR
jgi:hypothetical protein